MNDDMGIFKKVSPKTMEIQINKTFVIINVKNNKSFDIT